MSFWCRTECRYEWKPVVIGRRGQKIISKQRIIEVLIELVKALNYGGNYRQQPMRKLTHFSHSLPSISAFKRGGKVEGLKGPPISWVSILVRNYFAFPGTLNHPPGKAKQTHLLSVPSSRFGHDLTRICVPSMRMKWMLIWIEKLNLSVRRVPDGIIGTSVRAHIL